MFVAVLRQSLGIGLSLIAGPWFLCIFVNTLPWASVFRVWDVFLLEGIRVLFRVTIAIIILNKTAIMQACRAAFFLMPLLSPLCFLCHWPRNWLDSRP